MKIPKWINDRLPISKKTYDKDMKAIIIVINALKQADTHLSQVQMNILKTLNTFQSNKKAKNGEKVDKAYQ